MQRLMNFAILYMVFSFFSVHAMRKIECPIQNTRQIVPVDDSTIAIGGSNGFCFYSIPKNETINFVEMADPVDDMCCNKSGAHIAIAYKNHITIYDTTKEKNIVKDITLNTANGLSPQSAITFNSQDENILFIHCQGFLKIQNITGFDDESFIQQILSRESNGKVASTSILCHPLKPLLLTSSHCIQCDSFHPCIYDYHSKAYSTSSQSHVVDYKFNKDGSLLAIKDSSLLLLQQLHPESSITNYFSSVVHDVKKEEVVLGCIAMAFHPKNNTLVTLFNNNGLYYWDCNNINWSNPKNLKKKITLPQEYKPQAMNNNKGICFSSNGRYVIIALQNTCIIRNIAWDVCSSKKQRYLIKTYWALQNITQSWFSENQNNENNPMTLLPYEIIQTCIELLYFYKFKVNRNSLQ